MSALIRELVIWGIKLLPLALTGSQSSSASMAQIPLGVRVEQHVKQQGARKPSRHSHPPLIDPSYFRGGQARAAPSDRAT